MISNRIRTHHLLIAILSCCFSMAQAAEPRKVTTLKYISFPPEFITQNETTLNPADVGHLALDPVQLARLAWKGYIQNQPEPWQDYGSRFFFDSRALPWPSLKHHGVDGLDVGMRTLGARARLIEMLGPEVQNDPHQGPQIKYLLAVTDKGPDSCENSWMAWIGDPAAPRKCCPMAMGMGTRYTKHMYEQTNDEFYRTWSLNILKSLKKYSHSYTHDGRPTATYGWNAYNICEPYCPPSECPTGDCGYLFTGWLCYITGWNTYAFSQWYETTANPEYLDFAVRLANRTCNTQYNGNDGAFNPDGSFGGSDPATNSGAYHMHGHTFIVPGFVHLGTQLINAEQRDAGLAFITRAKNIFEFLFDSSRNPDAGSWTGWLPEWLHHSMSWPGQPDAEGCSTADALEIATALAAASSADPSLTDLVDYYDAAERIFTGQLIEATFQVTPQYKKLLSDCIQTKTKNEMPKANPQDIAAAAEKQYQQALKDAARMTGQQLGACGFPGKTNNKPSNLPGGEALPSIHMQGCCASATVRGAYAIWKHAVTGNESQAKVNLAVNRVSPLLTVISSLPRQGELNIIVKSAKNVLVRTPAWTQKAKVEIYKNRKKIPTTWDHSGKYVAFKNTTKSDHLTVTYPLRIATVIETINKTKYTETWQGNTITNINPTAALLPMYQRATPDK